MSRLPRQILAAIGCAALIAQSSSALATNPVRLSLTIESVDEPFADEPSQNDFRIDSPRPADSSRDTFRNVGATPRLPENGPEFSAERTSLFPSEQRNVANSSVDNYAAPSSYAHREEKRGFSLIPRHHIGRDVTNEWTAETGAIFLTRSKGDDSLLIGNDLTTGTPNSIVDSRRLTFDYQPGFYFDITHRGEERDFEILAYGVTDLNSRYTFTGVSGDQQLALPNIAVSDFSSAEISYESEFYNVELSTRIAVTERLTFLTGFRWMELNERLTVGRDGNPALYSVRTRNDLFGFQNGLDLRAIDHDRLTVNVIGKFGMFTNLARQGTVKETTDFNDPVFDQPAGFNSSADRANTSLLFECGVNGGYRISDHVRLTGGYRVFWISQVALAPSQVAINDVFRTPASGTAGIGPQGANGLDTGDGVLYHGGHATLEITW